MCNLLRLLLSLSLLVRSDSIKPIKFTSSLSHFTWDESGEAVGEDLSFLETTAKDDDDDAAAVKDLVKACPDGKKINKITAKKGKSNYFQALDKGMSRFQTLCAQFDVDLFELGLAVASSGATAAGTGKVLPFSTVISFGLNLQITYGMCAPKDKGGGCALAVSAEASIGVTLGIKLGNLAGTQASAFMSGGFEIASENAITCDPDIHHVSFLTPLSFKCGAGRLIGLWFLQFFDSKLSHDPTFQATAYRALISDVEQLEVEDGVIQEQEAVSNLIVDLQAGRKEFARNTLSLTRNPLYLKGAAFNYMHEMFMAPVFWAEAQLAQIELQRIFEKENPDEALDGPFPQHSMHNEEAPRRVAVYPDVVGDDSGEDRPLPYTGEPVVTYLLSSDRLKRVYEKDGGSDDSETHPMTAAYDFYRSNDPTCSPKVLETGDDDGSCIVTHPGSTHSRSEPRLPWKSKPDLRVQWNGADGLFSTSSDALELRRRFVWYVRWLLEVQVLKAYFWPSPESGAGDIRRNYPKDLDRCADLPVSFEDVVQVSDFAAGSASLKLAHEWGLCSGGGQTLPPASDASEFARVCVKDFRYHWNPRYWCHVGKSLSAVPTDDSECNDKTAFGCIYLDRPRFERSKEVGNRTKRPQDRYLYTDEGDISSWGTVTDSYTTSRHDDFFPDEYEIPLWSANVFPGVIHEVMETMEQLRAIDDVAEGVELIHRFRSKLTPSPQHRGHTTLEDTEISKDGTVQSSAIPLSRKGSSFDLTADARSGRGCADDPLCITNSFAAFWRVAPRDRMEAFVRGKLVTFKEKIAAIMPGLAYRVQSGYVNKVKANLAAARTKLSAMTKTLVLQHRIEYSMGFTFGFTFGESGLGFCTPDTNTVQINMPLLQWNGYIEPGSLGRSVMGKPDEWGAEFFIFFPKIPVNVHIKRVGKLGTKPDAGYTWTISVKVRVKNVHPVGSFAVGETAASDNPYPMPHFVAAALPTLCETLLPALVRIIMYGGNALQNKKLSGTKALGLIRRALGGLLSPFGAVVAVGTAWFAPASLFSSDSRHALVVSMILKPGQSPTFKAVYAYTTVKEFTLPVGTALTAKPASVFGARFDIAAWINANILISMPSIFGKRNGKVQHFPPAAFRTPRCNECIEQFGFAARGYSRSYCPDAKGKNRDELCEQIQTSVRMFLDANGSPGFWRSWFGGGVNYATKKSYERLYGRRGTHKHVRQKFERSCEVWPTNEERRHCLSQEFCRYSGVACIVVPETDIDTAVNDLRTTLVDGTDTGRDDNVVRPRKHETSSWDTDMFDDADAYMAAGLLRRKGGNSINMAEKHGAFRRQNKAETTKLHAKWEAERRVEASKRETYVEIEKPDLWGPTTGHHMGGSKAPRHGGES